MYGLHLTTVQAMDEERRHSQEQRHSPGRPDGEGVGESGERGREGGAHEVGCRKSCGGMEDGTRIAAGVGMGKWEKGAGSEVEREVAARGPPQALQPPQRGGASAVDLTL